MNLLKRLASLFSGGGAPSGDKRYLTIYVLSRRCNEPISGQVDLLNELSKTDEGDHAFFTRKVLHTTGERRCFAQVEIQLYFNKDKKVVQHEVEGGRWLTSEEYAAELERFNAPPPEEEADEHEETDDAEQRAGAAAGSTSEEEEVPTATASSAHQPEIRTTDDTTTTTSPSSKPMSSKSTTGTSTTGTPTTEESDHA